MGCQICPRRCGADRKKVSGYCGCNNEIRISRIAPHYWEEPCLSGNNGSGTVFFTGCQLHCIFCQNYKISNGNVGRSYTSTEIYNAFFELKEQGVHNINLVTPDMYIPKLIPIIKAAKNDGLNLPFIMNCSGYENVEMINLLSGVIDIYLPDFKYMSPLLAKKYSDAINYPDVAKNAIDAMINQQPNCIFSEDGIMQKGVIVRHMMLPSQIHDSKKVLSFLYKKYGDSIYISIMSQYTPIKMCKYNELNRNVTQEEYNELIDFAISIGIKNSFIQEGEAASESFIPDFSV